MEIAENPGIEGLLVHDAVKCEGEYCCIHNPSDHPLKEASLRWRPRNTPWDVGLPIMERICSHGVGHPDPDHIAFIERQYGADTAEAEAVHGCDGCCTNEEN